MTAVEIRDHRIYLVRKMPQGNGKGEGPSAVNERSQAREETEEGARAGIPVVLAVISLAGLCSIIVTVAGLIFSNAMDGKIDRLRSDLLSPNSAVMTKSESIQRWENNTRALDAMRAELDRLRAADAELERHMMDDAKRFEELQRQIDRSMPRGGR